MCILDFQLQLSYNLALRLASTASHVIQGHKVLAQVLAPNAGTVPTDTSTALSVAPSRGTASGLQRKTSSSSQVGLGDIRVMTTTSGSWSRDSASPCHDNGDSVTLSLWMQWTLLRLTGTLTSHSDHCRGELRICIVVGFFAGIPPPLNFC